jgi:hypothetical protein
MILRLSNSGFSQFFRSSSELFKLRKMETNLIVETKIQVILKGEFSKFNEYTLTGG